MKKLDLNQLPTLKEQAVLIADLLKTRIGKGQTWYMVDQSWMKVFMKFVGIDELERYELPKHPGSVNNVSLFENYGTDIRSGLVEDLDFTFVPESAWNLLTSWYGFPSGQQPISRKVIEYGVFRNKLKIEIYLLRLNLCSNFELVKPVVLKFSELDLIQKIAQNMRNIFQISSNSDVRIWGLSSLGKFHLLPLDKSVQDIPLTDNQYVVIETKSRDQQWESPLKSRKMHLIKKSPSPTEAKGLASYRDIVSYENQNKPGLCGLVNISNTCYMNSVIQCLSHCPPLTYYFVNNLHLSDINSGKGQRSHGETAEYFGELIQKLWSGKYDKILPIKLLRKVLELSAEFTLGDQHDSQEFMEFLLNIIHEDLNKAIKPSIPLTVFKECSDEIVDATWSEFKTRINSVIVDNFYGLLKTTVSCSDCDKVSSKFDTFLSLPLSVPIKETKFKVRYIPHSLTDDIIDYLVSVSNEGTILDLLEELGKFINVPTDRLVLSQVIRNHCHHFFKLEEELSSVERGPNLVLFDIPRRDEMYKGSEGSFIVPVALWEVSENNSPVFFGNPFIILVPTSPITYQELYDLIMIGLSRCFKMCSTKLATSSETSGTDAKQEMTVPSFKLFVFDCMNYLDAQEVPNTGCLITFEEHLNHEGIAVQWTSESRKLWFEESVSVCYDITEGYSASELSLEDCLNTFTAREKLDNSDMWMCPDCQKYTGANIKYDLCKLPTVLVFHLKRYAYEKGQYFKITDRINFPIVNLRMEKFMYIPGEEPLTYNLFAVCNHHGSIDAGHYSAYIKYTVDNKWYFFNDTNIKSHQESEIVTDAAYSLFYLQGNLVNKLNEDEKLEEMSNLKIK